MEDTEFPEKDLPLKEDVSALGAMLGEILREQGGAALYERVEAARFGARARRQGFRPDGRILKETVAGLGADEASALTRAFSQYFGLVNLAERVHRIRRLRQSEHHVTAPMEGSLMSIMRGLAEAGVPYAQVSEFLARQEIQPVFTAHPTEAVRPDLLRKEQRIARALLDALGADDQRPLRETAQWDRIREEVTIGWQTDEHAEERPTVEDEARHVTFYVSEVIYRVVPPFFEGLERAVRSAFGSHVEVPLPLLSFGTWVGGDMDGNPNVGPDTLLATLAMQRALILGRYERELEALAESLTQSARQVAISEAILERMALVQYAAGLSSSGMPYRAMLLGMLHRLRATAEDDVAYAYSGPDELIADLQLIFESLDQHKGRHAGAHHVRRLLLRVRTFGFHLATLDVRQDARVHRRVLAELLQDPDFAGRSPDERASALLAASTEPPPEGLSDEASRCLAVFRAIGEGQRRFGFDAIGPYIISMAQGADDVLAVLHLARVAGLVTDGEVPVDVAPLFETVADLNNARATVESMLTTEAYQRHLVRRGHRQLVMLGYSDSSKDGGVAASRWALFQAQEELAAVTAASIILFHGRGGTMSRGGSKPREAILSSPKGASRSHLRVTEQGEIIHAKYGLRGIVRRTLELVSGALLETDVRDSLQSDTFVIPARWRAVMATIADHSRQAYRGLVYDDPDFYSYFEAATPIDVITRLTIGSRPSSRGKQGSIDSLRAIPWVFAWTQSRHLLTGWYGIGTGLERALHEHGVGTVREAAEHWPLLATLLSDVAMVLAKSDLEIAALYSRLAGPLDERLFPRIQQEYHRCCGAVCTIFATDDVLAHEPVLRRAIALRNPYVDPMSFVQVDLLERWRATDRQDQDLERALFSTVKGIARGLMNTG